MDLKKLHEKKTNVKKYQFYLNFPHLQPHILYGIKRRNLIVTSVRGERETIGRSLPRGRTF